MSESLLIKTGNLKHSDQVREILNENHIQFRAAKSELDKEEGNIIDFNKAVQQIHITEFYVQEEHLKMAQELVMQVPQDQGLSLYLKSYSFRSIFFALLWMGGIFSLFALSLGIKGFRTEKKWVALVGIFLSLGGIFISVWFFILPFIQG